MPVQRVMHFLLLVSQQVNLVNGGKQMLRMKKIAYFSLRADVIIPIRPSGLYVKSILLHLVFTWKSE